MQYNASIYLSIEQIITCNTIQKHSVNRTPNNPLGANDNYNRFMDDLSDALFIWNMSSITRFKHHWSLFLNLNNFHLLEIMDRFSEKKL